jgi:hypothetical protein
VRHKAGWVALGAIALTAVSATPVVAKPLRSSGNVAVVSVTPTPGRQHVLSHAHVNVVYVHPGLAFIVDLRNDRTRRKVQVVLSISRDRSNLGPIVKTADVKLASGAHAAFQFNQIHSVYFAQRNTLTLTVVDRSTHQVWKTTYPVIFALG